MATSLERLEKIKRVDLEIARYLCTPLGYRDDGRPIYPTLDGTAFKFHRSSSKIKDVKRHYIGADTGPERHLKEEFNG